MPWFKSDDSLYRHRKVRKLGRDKLPAIGLWQLAGTWCADNVDTNTGDGFIPDEQVELWDQRHRYAKRLVDVGLWERAEVDGEHGYVFHDWSDYQPTKATVEAEREAWRQRKELYTRPGLVSAVKERDGDSCRYCGVTVKWSDRRGPIGGTIDHVVPLSRGGVNEIDNLVVSCRRCNSAKCDKSVEEAGMILREPKSVSSYGTRSKPEKEQGSSGTDLSTRTRSRPSTSGHLEEGGSPPERADTTPPPQNRPADRCAKHTNTDHPPPCGDCADHRRAAQIWDADRIRREAERRSNEARQRAADRAAQIANCDLCDQHGYRGTAVCSHDPDAPDRAARGRALVEAALQHREQV